MDLVERGHHLEEQHGKATILGESNLPVDEQEDREGDHEEVEEPLVDRLAAPEEDIWKCGGAP